MNEHENAATNAINKTLRNAKYATTPERLQQLFYSIPELDQFEPPSGILRIYQGGGVLTAQLGVDEALRAIDY